MSLSILDYDEKMESGNSQSLVGELKTKNVKLIFNWCKVTVSSSKYLLIILLRE